MPQAATKDIICEQMADTSVDARAGAGSVAGRNRNFPNVKQKGKMCEHSDHG
jgi:hypothetical protein